MKHNSCINLLRARQKIKYSDLKKPLPNNKTSTVWGLKFFLNIGFSTNCPKILTLLWYLLYSKLLDTVILTDEASFFVNFSLYFLYFFYLSLVPFLLFPISFSFGLLTSDNVVWSRWRVKAIARWPSDALSFGLDVFIEVNSEHFRRSWERIRWNIRSYEN